MPDNVVNEAKSFEVIAVHKITDTERDGAYVLDITISVDGVTEHIEKFLSAPDDPHGVNPAVRKWMNQNPDAMVEPYVPPENTDEEKRKGMPALSARQLRLGLLAGGFTPAQVTASIDAMPDGPDKEKAKIEWEYATEFVRTHPLIASVGAALSLTPEQIDTMWNGAVSL